MNVFFIVIVIICLVVCVLYFFKTIIKMFINIIKHFLKQQLLDLLADEQLRDQTNQMFRNQLDRILDDKELNKNLRENVISNAKILSVDEYIIQCITEIIQTQLESTTTSERTRLAIEKLLKQHLENTVEQEWFNTNVKDQITRLVICTCDSPEIKEKIRSLIENVASGLAKSDETNKIINDFLLKIVNDKEFMKQSGTAIRRSLKHAAYGMIWNYGSAEHSDNTDPSEFAYVEIQKK